MKLFPRLPNRFAEDLFAQQSALPLGEIHGSVSHAYMIWPATGATRVGDQDLRELRTALCSAAESAGFPEPLARSEHAELDLALARALWDASGLSPVEAGFPDVWSFLALVLVPDIVWWRAAGSTNIERFVATDLTRHTLARLWWRAHLFTFGLEDPETGWELWQSTEIGEAELDQIQTRRGGYGRSPRAFRTLVRVYPTVIELADSVAVSRRTFWRQRYLRWILRLGAFTNFTGIPEEELQEDLLTFAREIAEAAVDTLASEPTSEVEEEEREEFDREVVVDDENPTTFDSLPLSSLVVRLTEAVRGSGAVPGEDLATAFERSSGIPVPLHRAEILNGIAWQAKALRYLALDDADGRPIWGPGPVLPAPDRRWRSWSIDSFKDHIGTSNGGGDDLATLCAELFAGRAGVTVKRIARAAMRETRE